MINDNVFKPGEIVTFSTMRSDLAIFNGTKCKIIGEKFETESGHAYVVEFINPTCLAFTNELHKE